MDHVHNQKPLSPCSLVVHPCADTFSTAKTCIMFPKHRRFIGTDFDPLCTNTALRGLVKTYSRRCLNNEPEITVWDAIIAAANTTNTLIMDIDANIGRRKLDSWDVPSFFNDLKTFPIYIHYCLSSMHKNNLILKLINY